MTRRVWAMLGALGLAMVASLGATPALAQPRPVSSIDQQAVVSPLDLTTVMPALAVASGNQVVSADDSGVPFIRATAQNGLVFEVHFAACDTAQPATELHGCKALYMTSLWNGVDATRRSQIEAEMARFLVQNALVNGGVLEDASPYLLRYVIADHGIAQGNLLSEFGNFVAIATQFHNQVSAILSQ